MKHALKILGISLLVTIIYIIVSAVMPFSNTFKELSQESNPTDLIYLLIVHAWITASVFYIGRKSEWNKKWLRYSIILVFIAVYGFMTQIETLFFHDSFKALSKSDEWLIMLTNIIALLVIIPLTLTMVKKSSHERKPIIDVKLNLIFRKIALLAIIYMCIYFLFGYFVVWQFADVREFYSGTPDKQSFMRVMAENLQDSCIIPFQLLRGLLFSTFILPIVFMLRNNRKELLISLILIFTTTAIVLIIPNSLFPDEVRWAHFIEMISSMTLFSVITWLVWQKRNHTNKSRCFWNKMAESYDKRVKKNYNKAYQDTIELSRNYLDPTHNILDFACGSGITTIELSENVKKIIAIDISEKMIKVARQKTIDKNINNIEYKVADLFDSKLNNTKFNVVLAFNILNFIEDPDEVLKRVKELLLPSGFFISATDCLGEKKSFLIMFNTLLSKLGLIPSIKKYSRNGLEKTIKKNGFDIIETKNLHVNPPNYYIVAKKMDG